ncbi:hypothetical protein [Kribbella sp. VKM Ac-2569]|uniref:hypothetical protein n=1 Tax=Kribbella sp. VKM Ac-2569 TaxID=2512220 RepID=UPI0013003851|nr:hypothetical protein [Kribbella sp. VKM Ac-2569]
MERDVPKSSWPPWVVAVLSSAVSIAVALLGGWVALSGTHFGAAEVREKESREKRAQIYLDYLAAARALPDPQTRLDLAFEEYEEAVKAAAEPGATNAMKARQVAALRELTAASVKAKVVGDELQKQADLIWVYGSNEAWYAHLELQEASGKKAASSGTDRAANARQGKALTQFLKLFCREASATPPERCDSG